MMDYQDEEDSRSTFASSEASQDMECDGEYILLDNYIFNYHHKNVKEDSVHYA
jgi:hypothetical protein